MLRVRVHVHLATRDEDRSPEGVPTSSHRAPQTSTGKVKGTPPSRAGYAPATVDVQPKHTSKLRSTSAAPPPAPDRGCLSEKS